MRYLALVIVVLAVGGAAQARTIFEYMVIAEGPRAGVTLNVGADGTAANRDLNAVGSVVVDSHCVGPHYHGTLNGRPDPDPTGCGWGRVLRRDATELVRHLTQALGSEEQSVTAGAYGFGKGLWLGYISAAMADARKAGVNGTLSRSDAAHLETLLRAVFDLDERWNSSIAAGERDPSFIHRALVKKRAALALIVDSGRKVSEAGAVAPPVCKGASSAGRRNDCFKTDFWDVNVPVSVKAVLCDFRTGTRTISGKRPLFPGVEQSLSCKVTGKTRVVDGVRKRIVHAELKLTVPPGSKAFVAKQVRVAVLWPA